MPLVDLFGDGKSRFRQGDVAVFVHQDKTVVPKKSHGTADRRLGIAHVFAHVDRADKG